jgi:hypothetical protein
MNNKTLLILLLLLLLFSKCKKNSYTPILKDQFTNKIREDFSKNMKNAILSKILYKHKVIKDDLDVILKNRGMGIAQEEYYRNKKPNYSLSRNFKPKLIKILKRIQSLEKEIEEKYLRIIDKNEKCFTDDWKGYHCQELRTLNYCNNSNTISSVNRNKVKSCCKEICRFFIELNKTVDKVFYYFKFVNADI